MWTSIYDTGVSGGLRTWLDTGKFPGEILKAEVIVSRSLLPFPAKEHCLAMPYKRSEGTGRQQAAMAVQRNVVVWGNN
jgi:hypothetical protein